jgi:hypothetical protein
MTRGGATRTCDLGDVQHDDRFTPIPGIAAAVLPGLGYAVQGRFRRAFAAAVGVLGLVFGGLFIGGIGVVDRREDTLWFVAQAFVGPVTFGIDYVHQTTFKVRMAGPPRPPTPEEWLDWDGPEPRPARPAIGKVSDVGSLYVAIAGMLNLIIIVDCFLSRVAGDRGGSGGSGARRARAPSGRAGGGTAA